MSNDEKEECEHNRPFWECEICGNRKISKRFKCGNCKKVWDEKALLYEAFFKMYKCPECRVFTPLILMANEYIEKPIEIELVVPYYMPLKIYKEFRKRVKENKKFIVTHIKGAHERGEGFALEFKLVMEW